MTSPWRKSSHSFSNGNCAEVAAWRTASRSYGAGECAEVGQGAAAVAVRDTKLGAASPVLAFPPAAFTAFLRRVKAGAA